MTDKNKTVFMSGDNIKYIDDRLADVLCAMRGFAIAAKLRSGGNNQVNEAMLELNRFITDNLTPCRDRLHKPLKDYQNKG